MSRWWSADRHVRSPLDLLVSREILQYPLSPVGGRFVFFVVIVGFVSLFDFDGGYYSEQKVLGSLHNGKPGNQGLRSRTLVQYKLLPVISRDHLA